MTGPSPSRRSRWSPTRSGQDRDGTGAGAAGYDAAVILGSGIRRVGGGYRPVTYDDHDDFGMVAGEIRVIAAVVLYEQRLAGTFVFSTGTSEKTRAALGPGVPTEAVVYSQDFLRRIASSGLPAPTVILEDRSVNTYSNLVESIAVIGEHGWERVAIVTARYHIPRVRALWEVAKGNHPAAASAAFLAAEDIVTRYLPGVYDDVIAAAYRSPQGRKRLTQEAQGLQDLTDGRYIITEFRLPPGYRGSTAGRRRAPGGPD